MIQAVLSAQEQAEIARIVQEHNQIVNNGRMPQQQLGKDDFLKLLVTQLSYQDPTAPMQDKEFIAQLAQFSTLDQMTSMANDFSKLSSMLSVNEASGALGRNVDIIDNDTLVQGTIKAITRGEATPLVMVNGQYYKWEQVTKIYEDNE
ncbi:MAG: flagellar hook assembly protein FlgD [Treponema sp.]|jgi:flagellar basal-body rod modification protein FlgD|nr:flagellar hook assembly protein FlgD [Treponema sp.]